MSDSVKRGRVEGWTGGFGLGEIVDRGGRGLWEGKGKEIFQGDQRRRGDWGKPKARLKKLKTGIQSPETEWGRLL